MHLLNEADLAGVGIRPKKTQPFASLIPEGNDRVHAERFSIAKHWVSLTTGQYNQDVTCLINGVKGSGKSNFMLAEGWTCAERTAAILGGQPSDYFSIDNVCIMDPDSIIDVLTRPEKNRIIGLDDTGTINGARAFRTDLNQWVNNILITNRPQHNITLMTTPDQGHVDKQAREIGNYYIEMVPNTPLRSRGYSLLKFFRREKNYRTGKSLWKYLHWNDAKIVRCILPRAPKWLEDEYDAKRDIYMRKVWARATEDLGMIEDITSPHERRQTKSQKAAQAKASSAQKAYDEIATTTSLTHAEILHEIGVKRRVWYDWQDNGYVKSPVTRHDSLMLTKGRNADVEIAEERYPAARPPPKFQRAAQDRAQAARMAYDKLSATTALTHTELLAEIGVKKQTWSDWVKKGYIPQRR